MSFIKSCAVLAIATGFAAAKPIFPRAPEDLPAYSRRSTAVSPVKRNGGFDNNDFFNNNDFNQKDKDIFNGNNDNFNFIDGFNNFNNQQNVLQFNEENLFFQDDGDNQILINEVKNVLVVENEQNKFNNDLNNLFRKSNFRNNNRDRSTVILVVQQIDVQIQQDDNVFVSQVFAQSVQVANRGRGETDTTQIFEAKTLIANIDNDKRDRFNQGFNQGFGNKNGFFVPTPTGNGVFQTGGVQLFGQKPSWSNVAEDPAATLGGIWQAEIQDGQNAQFNQENNDQNKAAIEAEKQLQEQQAAEEQQNQDAENQDQEQVNQEQQAADEAAKAEEEKKAAEEAAKQEQEQQAAEEAPVEEAPVEEAPVEEAPVEGEVAPAERL